MLGDTNTVFMSRNAQEKMVNTSGCYIVEHRNGLKIPKIWVLDLKECIEFFQVVCLESYYSETFNQMHADTSFHNGLGASMKWRETFENMSFGPKVVDWACSLLENKKRFWRQKLGH